MSALAEAHGPDPAVFGAPRSRQSLAELDALGTAAGLAVYYACCQVRGLGLRCWHCERYGQITPEPERIESDGPIQVVTSRGEPAASAI